MARRSTCIHALEHHARRIGGTPALVQGNRYLTYRDLDRRANQVAHALLEHGLRRAERVAIALPNGFEFMEVACGAWKCAAVAMPFAQQLSDEALVQALEDSGSVGVVVDEAHAEAFERSYGPVAQAALHAGRGRDEARRSGPRNLRLLR